MPQPVSYNTGNPVSGSLQDSNIAYVVDGQSRNYRGGYGGLSWMSEVPAVNNVIFIGNTTTIGRGPADKPLFYPSFNTTQANIVYAVNTLPGSPGNFTTSASAYDWAATNNFFINNSDNPIPRIDADGLQAYLDSSQPTSYPQTGTSWYDLSGFSGTAGSLINGPTWNQNGYFELDNTNDQIRITGPDYNALAASGNFTIIITGKKTEYGTGGNNVGNSTLFQGVDNGYSGGWRIIETNTGTPGGSFSSPHAFQIGLPVLNSDRYVSDTVYRPFFYAFSFTNGNTGLAFLNGYLSQGSNNYGGGSTNQGYISYGGAGVGLWGGWIKSVQVYNKGLSLEEIKQNYFQSNIIQDGLVFMADANNLVSYPKSGTAAYNLTGSGTGTLTNGPTFNQGNGGYWEFDGTNDYINFGNIVNLGTSDFTLSVWVYIPSGTASTFRAILNKKGASAANAGYGIYYNTGMQKFLWSTADGTTASEKFTSNTFADIENTWAHVVMVRQSGATNNGHYYVNGVYQSLASAGAVLNVDSSTNLSLAIAGNTYASYCFQGNIANAKIYNRALSATEVQQNYEATKDKFQGESIVTNGLVLYWDAGDKDSYPGTGTTIYDLSGNGNDGGLMNGPIFSSDKGGAIIFDGSDDYIITNLSGDTGTTSYTIINVMQSDRPSSDVNNRQSLFGFDNGSGLGYQVLSQEIWGQGGYGFTGDGTNIDIYTWNIAGNSGDLKIYGCVRTPSQVKTYVNGVITTTNNVTKTSAFTRYTVGERGPSGGNNWSGPLFCSLVYNRELTAGEMEQVYDTLKGRFGLT